MSTSLATPASRRRLAVRHPPYWKQITRGVCVGYRNQGKPAWYVRRYLGGRYIVRTIGIADDQLPADGERVLTWKDAVKRANEPDATLEPGRQHSHTVADVGTRYLEHRRTRSPARSVGQDALRWKAFILPDLGAKRAEDLTTTDLSRWMDGLVAKAQPEPGEATRRAKAGANRVWNTLRAALNLAFKEGSLASDVSWQRIAPYENVDKPRTRFLSQDEAVALLAKLDHEFKDLARGALNTGLREGELMALTVADVKGGSVYVKPGKTGKERYVPLSREGATFFKKLAHGRGNDELVFGMDDADDLPGRARRVRLSRQMRRACKAAGIARATFHDLRRSYGSLLLNSGASMDQIRVALGHADLRMTSRTYAHLTQESLAKAINAHLPSFNGTPKKKRARKPKKARA